MEREEMTRKHIVGVLSSYTGKTLSSDLVLKLTNDIVQCVFEAENTTPALEKDSPQ